MLNQKQTIECVAKKIESAIKFSMSNLLAVTNDAILLCHFKSKNCAFDIRKLSLTRVSSFLSV